ncbi:putative ester cyclase [Streptomyces sp. 3211.6]|uniref:ester cyclase n=1 Tax=Streptomyces TaxID=1883 RepID=UPI0009A4F665|nr:MULTISPECIES: ester cyclase [Streptomyces]RKT08125.1 putative ester cyclase [Streptomyces sp. 3211.6]RPF44246.1 putative ester cyclase [Streptomyces sp. Ag109_G2-6]
MGVQDDNKQAVLGFFTAVSERRTADLPQYMTEDVIDHNQIIHGEPDEPGAAFEGLRRQLAAFDPLTVRVEELVAEDERVVARVVMSGTHGGTHPRMPEPTGRSFENEAIWLFTLTGGRISQIRAVSDRLGLFLQLGWDWPRTD